MGKNLTGDKIFVGDGRPRFKKPFAEMPLTCAEKAARFCQNGVSFLCCEFVEAVWFLEDVFRKRILNNKTVVES